MRNSFIFYKSFYEALLELTSDQKALVIDLICAYQFDGEIKDCAGIPNAIFKLIKPQLDANNTRYENGRKGGRPAKSETKQKPKRNQNETKPEPNDNVNVNVNVNVEEKKKYKKKTVNLPEWLPESLWDSFLEMRKAKRSPATPHAQNLIIKKTEKLANETADRVAIIEQSIRSGWLDAYPLKSDTGNQQRVGNGYNPNAALSLALEDPHAI